MKIKVIRFKTVNSTNDIAIKLIKAKKINPALIISKKQTKGRGTMGKKWISLKGNLFLSIYFEIDQSRLNFKQFNIINALVLRKVISKFTPKKISIKWPNDLIYNKKKFCGILQEIINFNNKNFLIIGIGLNTNFSPNNEDFLSTSLKNITNKRINNNIILKNIIKRYEKLLNETKKLTFLELKKRYN